jgi:hypothetical protein
MALGCALLTLPKRGLLAFAGVPGIKIGGTGPELLLVEKRKIKMSKAPRTARAIQRNVIGFDLDVLMFVVAVSIASPVLQST